MLVTQTCYGFINSPYLFKHAVTRPIPSLMFIKLLTNMIIVTQLLFFRLCGYSGFSQKTIFISLALNAFCYIVSSHKEREELNFIYKNITRFK